jgi:alpha-glucoside transport system substrate-binding protein
VSEDAYGDDITRELATALAGAETFRFDASDLMPAAFGSDALFKGLQDFLGNPDNVQQIQKQLENQAKKAYK